ncbi:MAG: DUF3391 domain-containing protein [Gammaproteobacteria bacterium]|nr:DUF3391 domain-containing protein [Gammaproteobacteria bacterium]
MAELKVPTRRLQPGMFIRLPLGWRDHPFVLSSFRIKDEGQVLLIRQLATDWVWFDPEKSSAGPLAEASVAPLEETSGADNIRQQLQAEKSARIEELQNYRRSLQKCEKQFEQSLRQVRSVVSKLGSRPLQAVTEAQDLIKGMVDSLLTQDELVLHLMGEGKEGEQLFYHSLNVSVLAMLIGKAKGLERNQIEALGLAGLFHDIGKVKIPSAILNKNPTQLSAPERNLLALHPRYGVDLLANAEGFPADVKRIILEHHEAADGSGTPKGLRGDELGDCSLLFALINAYDSLCHPSDIRMARPPYVVLSHLYRNARDKYVASDIELMIRQMGVYPPGTVVELSGGQIGMVMSINPAKLLAPNVLLYDPQIPRQEAPIIALDESNLTISKALVPGRLPEAVREYLNPRTRISYFYEQKP